MSNFITGDIFTLRPPKQTLKAWQPLWDCTSILFTFQNSDFQDEGEELPEWRIQWIAGLSLLRAVGHVLFKVDAKKSLYHQDEIEKLWLSFKDTRSGSSAIFWNFIEQERNNLLKTYSFGAKLEQDENGYFIEFSDGQDAFQLFREAVYWWRYHLMALEAKLPQAL